MHKELSEFIQQARGVKVSNAIRVLRPGSRTSAANMFRPGATARLLLTGGRVLHYSGNGVGQVPKTGLATSLECGSCMPRGSATRRGIGADSDLIGLSDTCMLGGMGCKGSGFQFTRLNAGDGYCAPGRPPRILQCGYRDTGKGFSWPNQRFTRTRTLRSEGLWTTA